MAKVGYVRVSTVDQNTDRQLDRLSFENVLFTGDDNPTKHLMLSMMGAVAQFERSMIRERQREGIAQAKAKGVYTGRVKTVDDAAIRALVASNVSYRKAAEQLGVSLSTVQRAMKTA